MLGTGIFVFVGGANALAHRYPTDVVPIESTALVWGLSFMVLKYSLAHISGAFMNPASTIAFAIVKKVPWRNVTFFSLIYYPPSTYSPSPTLTKEDVIITFYFTVITLEYYQNMIVDIFLLIIT